MTQPALPSQPVAPPMSLEQQFAYVMAQLNMQGENTDAVMREVADRLAESFADSLDALDKAAGFKRAEPLERLIWYRGKPDRLWTEQMLKLPNDYTEDWNDWQALRERALNGDFGPAQQAEEIAWSQQAEMGVQQ